MKNCLNYTSYATRPFLCFLQSNLDKTTAGAHKEPSTRASNTSNTEEQTHCAVS